MRKLYRPLLALAGAALFTSLLGGCGSSEEVSSTTPSPPPSTTTTTQTQAPQKDLNPLTGQRDLEKGASTRPVAVMIGNNDKSRPQPGLDQADLYVEMETEGGITRIMAVFANSTRLPDKLGPVRSARTPFALLAQSLDAIYCHAGGSSAGLSTIDKQNIPHLNALAYDGTAFWRDPTLRQQKGLEYSMMTSADKLTALIQKADFRSSSNRAAPFRFGEKTGNGAGQTVQVVFSGSQSIHFRYDAASRQYDKYNGRIGTSSPHQSAEGRTLSVSNVVVLYDDKYAENNTTISFRLKSGAGQLITGGTSRDIRWSRSSNGLVLTETDGSSLQVSPGKTYICVVTKGNQDQTICQ